MDEQKEETNFKSVGDDLKNYVTLRIRLASLQLAEKSSETFSAAITSGSAILFFVLFFVFASLALALYLSAVLQSNSLGFGLVAILYLVIGVIIWLVKDKYLEPKLTDVFIKQFFKEKSKADGN